MLTWMKRLVASGAMALAIGATGVMVTSPVHAADDAKSPQLLFLLLRQQLQSLPRSFALKSAIRVILHGCSCALLW